MSSIKPPEHEIRVGLEEYASSGKGIGGRLKEQPSDFIVKEITPDGMVLDFDEDVVGDTIPGDYTHFTLVKENWDTMRALKELAKRTGVSRSRFSFAGTKDRRAVTAQRVSAYKVPAERLAAADIRGVRLKDYSFSDENLGLGSLWGNRFQVTVRDIPEDAADRIEAISSEIETGFPNYYGLQRFGEVRPVTHEVGLRLLRGDFEGAVMAYLTKSFEGEDEAVRGLRDRLAETYDFQAALNEYPTYLGYEKALLNHLVQHGGDYVGALRTLPRNLGRMFIHAYQSYVFNRALSECIRRGLSSETLPLVGLEVAPDDISAKILGEDGMETGDFRVDGMRELSSRGEYRNCYQAAEDFSYSVSEGDAVFEFSLSKGSYATVLLREFMKS
jgi:tRNA pseudouridine13 synthase